MTIEAKRSFLGIIPLGGRKVFPGETISYEVQGIHGSTRSPVGITLEILSKDKINDTRDISAVNEELGRREGTPDRLHFVRERQEINQSVLRIPSRVPGVRTELKWSPPSLADKMLEALWKLAERGLIDVDLELLMIKQKFGERTAASLSSDFKKLLNEMGVAIPVLSMNGREIAPQIAEEFLKKLTGTSPRGLLGGWKDDEKIFMGKDQHLRLVRTIKLNPANANDWDSGTTITYTLQ